MTTRTSSASFQKSNTSKAALTRQPTRVVRRRPEAVPADGFPGSRLLRTVSAPVPGGTFELFVV